MSDIKQNKHSTGNASAESSAGSATLANGGTEPNVAGVESGIGFWLMCYLKGITMGLADSVPGVSGGTLAVITGIYERLIFAIKSVDRQALNLLLKGRFKASWLSIDGSFLLVVAMGMLSGLLVSANTVLYLLDQHFEPLMGFFLGLVLASSWYLLKEFSLRSKAQFLSFISGLSLMLLVSVMTPTNGEGASSLYLFMCGAIAICAMILPGLSGAFLLLMLGVYEFVLESLLSIDLVVIFIFGSGCAVGLLAFSRVIAWALSSYHQASYGFLTGMLVASVNVLWPWQNPVSYYTDRHGDLDVLLSENVSPLHYEAITGNPSLLVVTFVCVLLGALAVLLIHQLQLVEKKVS